MAITPWSWERSNGTATNEQTRQAYAALVGKDYTAKFSYHVWNDLVNKTYEVAIALGRGWQLLKKGMTIDEVKMAQAYDPLSSDRFNAMLLNSNYPVFPWSYDRRKEGYLGRNYVKGVSEVGDSNADYVYGSYFLEYAQRLNVLIEAINGTGTTYEGKETINIQLMMEPMISTSITKDGRIWEKDFLNSNAGLEQSKLPTETTVYVIPPLLYTANLNDGSCGVYTQAEEYLNLQITKRKLNSILSRRLGVDEVFSALSIANIEAMNGKQVGFEVLLDLVLSTLILPQQFVSIPVTVKNVDQAEGKVNVISLPANSTVVSLLEMDDGFFDSTVLPTATLSKAQRETIGTKARTNSLRSVSLYDINEKGSIHATGQLIIEKLGVFKAAVVDVIDWSCTPVQLLPLPSSGKVSQMIKEEGEIHQDQPHHIGLVNDDEEGDQASVLVTNQINRPRTSASQKNTSVSVLAQTTPTYLKQMGWSDAVYSLCKAAQSRLAQLGIVVRDVVGGRGLVEQYIPTTGTAVGKERIEENLKPVQLPPYGVGVSHTDTGDGKPLLQKTDQLYRMGTSHSDTSYGTTRFSFIPTAPVQNTHNDTADGEVDLETIAITPLPKTKVEEMLKYIVKAVSYRLQSLGKLESNDFLGWNVSLHTFEGKDGVVATNLKVDGRMEASVPKGRNGEVVEDNLLLIDASLYMYQKLLGMELVHEESVNNTIIPSLIMYAPMNAVDVLGCLPTAELETKGNWKYPAQVGADLLISQQYRVETNRQYAFFDMCIQKLITVSEKISLQATAGTVRYSYAHQKADHVLYIEAITSIVRATKWIDPKQSDTDVFVPQARVRKATKTRLEVI